MLDRSLPHPAATQTPASERNAAANDDPGNHPAPGQGSETASSAPAAAAPDAPAPDAAAPANPDPKRTFYGELFEADEVNLIASLAVDPAPQDELWLQRVVNRRLFEFANREPAKDADRADPKAERLVSVAALLAQGVGRASLLLRELHARGQRAESAPEAVRHVTRTDNAPLRRWQEAGR